MKAMRWPPAPPAPAAPVTSAASFLFFLGLRLKRLDEPLVSRRLRRRNARTLASQSTKADQSSSSSERLTQCPMPSAVFLINKPYSSKLFGGIGSPKSLEE